MSAAIETQKLTKTYGRSRVFYYYGTAIKDGIDWANFAGVTLAALFVVLLGVLAFSRRDIYT